MKKIIQSPKLQLELAFIILDALVYLMFYPIWSAVFDSTFFVATDIAFVLGVYILCTIKRFFMKTYTPRLPVVAFINFMYFSMFIGAFVLIQNYFGSVYYTGLSMMICMCVSDFKNHFTSYPKRVFTVKWYYIGEPIMIYMCGVYTHVAVYKKVALFFVMLLILIYFWCTYLSEMIKYFEINRHMENVPTNNIFYDNSYVFVRIIGILAIVLLFATFFEFDEVFVWIGRLILLIVAGFVAVFGKIMEFFLALFPGNGDGNFSQNMQQTNYWLQQNSWLLSLLGYVFSFILIVYLLRKFRGAFKRERVEKDYIPEKHIVGRDSTDEIEEILPKEKVKKTRMKDNREKIRRIFKSKMEKKYSKRVPKYMTAKELASESVGEKNDLKQSQSKLAAYYDEARYSEHEMTAEQVSKVKKEHH